MIDPAKVAEAPTSDDPPFASLSASPPRDQRRQDRRKTLHFLMKASLRWIQAIEKQGFYFNGMLLASDARGRFWWEERMSLGKSAAFGLFAVAVSLVLPSPAPADPTLPGLTNLDFLSYTGAAPKSSFSNVDPTGWTGGSGLIYIDTPGTSNTSATTACGPTYLQTYGCPSTLAIPGGYNEVEADGNPDFESGFNYEVTGLTVGTTYELSFYQAASQQTGFSGATTEQWIVSLGTTGLQDCAGCLGGGLSYYYNPDSTASVAATTLMHTPSGGMTDWNSVTVYLTADSTSDLLSFLAWGDSGSTINEPPIVFLTGVNTPGYAPPLPTPEPASLTLFGVGLLGLGLARRWRAKCQDVEG